MDYAWIALKDTCVDNGCMWFVPGSYWQRNSFRFSFNNRYTKSEIITAFEGEGKPEEHVATSVL